MNLFPVLFVDAPRWVELAGFLIRFTIVAALGHLAIATLWRAAASRRHMVAVATLAALLVMPVAVALLPTWRIALLPARTVKPAAIAAAESWKDAPVVSRIAAPSRNGGSDETRPSRSWKRAHRAARDVSAPRPTGWAPAAPNVVTPPTTWVRADAPPPSPVRAAREPVRISWRLVLMTALFAGMALVLLRLLVALARAGWLARRAEPVLDAGTLEAFAWARERMGVGSSVGLARSSGVPVPIVTGVVHPVLLLPAESAGWSAARLRIVFLHELAHVRRGDAAALLLGRLATALFWFHPLVWSLARAARCESERACDDMVLETGVRASEYARELLEIGARGGTRDALAVATLAVARRSSLEARLISILRSDQRRAPATRPAVALAVLVAALLLLPVVTVQVVAAPDRHATTRTVTSTSATTRTVTVAGQSYSVSHAVSEGTGGSCSRTVDCTESQACTESKACGDVQAAKDCAEAQAAQAYAEALTAQSSAGARAAQAYADAMSSHAAATIQLAGYKSGDGLYSQARRLYESKQYNDAGDTYRQAAMAGYRPATSFYNAGCSYALDGQTGLALSALAEARDAGFDDLELLSKDSDLDSIRGDHRFQLIQLAIRHTDKAEAELRSNEAQFRALDEANSKDSGAWKSIGMTLMRSGSPDLGAEAFGRQYQIDGSPSAIYNQACAYALDREREKAFDALRKSIQVGFGDDRQVAEDADLASLHDDPRFSQLVELTRDLTLYRNGIDDDDRSTWQAALPRFERVAREHADIGRAWFNLGFARLRCNDLPGSRQAFTKSLDLRYKPATSMYNLACVEAQAKNRDAAIQWLQKADQAGMEMSAILSDKDLDPLRSDARFQSLTEKVREQKSEKKRAAKS